MVSDKQARYNRACMVLRRRRQDFDTQSNLFCETPSATNYLRMEAAALVLRNAYNEKNDAYESARSEKVEAQNAR